MKYLQIILSLGLAVSSQAAMGGGHNGAAGNSVPVGSVSAAEFEQLKANFVSLQTNFVDLASRFNALESENTRLRQGQVENQSAVAEIRSTQEASSRETWADRISIKGDFRYRYQNDDVDLDGINSRNRQRIRARPAVTARLPANIEVGFGLATGSDSPVSANQTIGGTGSSKDINLDLAYFSWGTPVEGLTVEAGKFKNEFVRAGGNGLLYDSDWRPEGAQLLYQRGLLFGNVLATYLEADGSDGRGEQFAWGAQAGIRTDVGPARLRAGASYFDIRVKGETCLLEADECFGNTPVADPNNPGDFLYANDFSLIEGFAELDFEFFGLPTQLFADYVVNDDADANDTGYAVGGRIGKVGSRGSWEAGYLWEDLEADAVLGVLTDSNFGGGGTDSKGHKMSAAYGLTDSSYVRMTYFLTERQDTNGLENGGEKFDVDILQLDLQFKYK